ncbi:hypothetical protein CATRI_11655 [Corynebacterium atrinae]|uniref:hypothetical protein n=1 Tax=Corynebacterium atrinae TaxID=1336740 RepID=UPI0025B3E60B|nr:hypothetical protein [Corynebacterium atrinae]WJY64380.1 hypothetical protein CATRI_11655 [Corynebacterium atrinae]
MRQKVASSGDYLKLAPATYISRADYFRLPREDMVRARAMAWAGARPTSVIAGLSAAALHDYPLPQWISSEPIELSLPNYHSSRPMSGLRPRHHPPALQERTVWVRNRFGLARATDPLLSGLDLARWHRRHLGVQALDQGLRRGLFSSDELASFVTGLGPLSGIKVLRQVARQATPFSDSPRESMLKSYLFDAGLPAPHQQAKIFHRSGAMLGRFDFFWPEISFAVEYDGQGKYLGEFGTDREEAVFNDLHRQHSLSNVGITIFRANKFNFPDGSAIEGIRELYRLLSMRNLPFVNGRWESAGLAWR